jgi:hypothetical protein
MPGIFAILTATNLTSSAWVESVRAGSFMIQNIRVMLETHLEKTMKTMLTSFIALVPGVCCADISLVYPQQTQCKTTLSAMQISGSRMRVDIEAENEKFSMLFDGMEDIITTLDHSEKQYHQTEVDEDALDYSKDVMSSAGTFMDKQMQNIQAQMKQQCAQLEKQGMSCPNMDLSSMMRNAQAMMDQNASQIQIRQSDKKQTVAGMDCKTFDRYLNRTRTREECYIEPKDLLMPEQDRKYLLRNMKVMLRYSDTFGSLAEKFKTTQTDQEKLPDPANKNMLLAQTCFAPNGDEAGRIEVQVSNTPVDETRFDIPAAYRMMSMTGQDQ